MGCTLLLAAHCLLQGTPVMQSRLYCRLCDLHHVLCEAHQAKASAMSTGPRHAVAAAAGAAGLCLALLYLVSPHVLPHLLVPECCSVSLHVGHMQTVIVVGVMWFSVKDGTCWGRYLTHDPLVDCRVHIRLSLLHVLPHFAV